MAEILRRIQEATQEVTDRVQDVADKVTASVGELLGVGGEAEAPEAPRAHDEPVVSFRDVHLAFDRPILRGVSFDLHAGATKIVLGGSGSGKTTLLRLILGLLKPDAGSIRVDGVEVSSLPEEELRRVRLKIGMVFQEGALFDSMSVADNVGYRLVEDGEREEVVAARVGEILGFVGLGAHADKSPSELSGGQRRRVAFARALAARPGIMLYDEPTTGLDPITATTITDLIVKVRDLDGATSILVTHQLRDAFNVARTFVRRQGDEFGYQRIDDLEKLAGTEFLMLREGSVVFEGSPHELQSSREPYIREFLS
jgi:phospholipid/cholesterol/gamma-HCH transport system ATP-binding protein